MYDGDGMVSLLVTISVTIALLGGALWALRRLRPGAASWNGLDCAVLRALPLGPRERLLVVRIGARHLVIGIGGGAVSLLCELDGPLPPPASIESRFGAAIRQAMTRWRGGA
jgi:flagellar protein FliO/FliZ